MEVHTTLPGIQLYTSNFLDGSIVGKGGAKYEKYAGVCLETEGFPGRDPPRELAQRWCCGRARRSDTGRCTRSRRVTCDGFDR